MRQITFRAALNEALREEMSADGDVLIMGEDIGRFGGVYAVTKGLYDEFGEWRVIDTPISEAAMVGMATGAAMVGKRPIVEIMYMDFLLVCADQLGNQAAKMRYMSGGQVAVPMTIRTQTGGWRGGGAQHTQCLESMFAQMPGLKIAMPATPADAKGMLKSAIRDDNPVVFVEHRLLYAAEGEVPDGEHVVPLGQAEVKREGSDLTLITSSMMVHHCLAAADELASAGVDVEVVDVRSIVPLDMETIAGSVAKTSRAVVAHQSHRSFGWGAEVAARIGEECFDDLDGPVRRIGAADVPYPSSKKLEEAVLPSAAKIVAACRDVVRS